MTEGGSNVSAAMPPSFGRFQQIIATGLKSEISSQSLELYDMLRYHMGWVDESGNPTSATGGKRFRPTLCLLACEAFGGSPEQALPPAVALEFVHNFSLIHDDIEDQDRYRHHRLTLWAVWGVPPGIVAGNCMLKLADRSMRRLGETGLSPSLVMEASEELARGYLRMMEGQYLDMSYEGRVDITVPDYLAMIERKTGALIETAVYLGAFVAGGDQPDRDRAARLRTVGWELGRMFQIRDDILGVWGGPKTGKPVGADIQRRKKALPAVHALGCARGAAGEQLRRIYAGGNVTNTDVETVLEIMEKLETARWCQRMAEERWRNASIVIKSLQLAGDAAKEFNELGEFLLTRES